jgi:hypothetical protein
MKKEISINYSVSASEATCVVPLNYTVEKAGKLLTISCLVATVSPNVFPWLQLRKFEIKSVLEGGGRYSVLFNDDNNARTIDTALFIDNAYASIMAKEKLLMLADAVA